ncbi:hypothetical protein JXI42_00105 [bacterium]|nr:hypothetical protein [bacterium]
MDFKLFFFLLVLLFGSGGVLLAGSLEHSESDFWENGVFRQTCVDMSKYSDGIIKAEVEGEWQEFEIHEFPKAFLNWNFERRLEMLDNIKNHQPPSLSGPHNGAVASHGTVRKDSKYSINNAVKGMGFVPRAEKLDGIISLLKAKIDEDFGVKLGILESLYTNPEETFDFTKQVSLELYSTPEFETHTFLNLMVDPGVSVVFLDVPSFEFRAIVQMLHPDDPELTGYEKKVVEYINLVHSFFHGEFEKQFIGVIYHVIEVFDNSPGKREALGKRITP